MNPHNRQIHNFIIMNSTATIHQWIYKYEFWHMFHYGGIGGSGGDRWGGKLHSRQLGRRLDCHLGRWQAHGPGNGLCPSCAVYLGLYLACCGAVVGRNHSLVRPQHAQQSLGGLGGVDHQHVQCCRPPRSWRTSLSGWGWHCRSHSLLRTPMLLWPASRAICFVGSCRGTDNSRGTITRFNDHEFICYISWPMNSDKNLYIWKI